MFSVAMERKKYDTCKGCEYERRVFQSFVPFENEKMAWRLCKD